MSLHKTLQFITQHPLTADKPISAIIRFVGWQIRSRVKKGPFILPFIQNTRLWMQRGWTGVTGNLYTGLHEYEDMGFLLHFLREEDVFADVGANMGSYTILASGVSKAFTYSFEPAPFSYDRLLANIQLNGIEERVQAINAAVGSLPGELQFTTDEDTTNHILSVTEENGMCVPVVTLDMAMDKCPSLIKIDVEGYETEVLNGAKNLLLNQNLKAIIIELNGSGARYGYDENAIKQQLTQAGFLPYQYKPQSRKLQNLTTFSTQNTIYCRDLAYVQDRLDKAPVISILHKTI